ncbi:MAG: DHH family phosphoesterase [Patescibacteria group bacterium]
MNNNQNSLSRIHEIINKGNSGIILIPPNSTPDSIAAACSLYLGLTKIGKNVALAASTVPQSDVVGSDKIKNQFATGGDSLMVSFPYSDGSIDKVDYNIQGNSFNLIVTPRPGFAKLDPGQVSYSYTGGSVDFLIVIDSPTLNNLGNIYTDNQNQFTGHDIINIDRHLTNAFFGTVNLVNKTASSISELILGMLQELKVEIDRDMATNLYAGIAAATNNFTSYSVSAETFEHIATLLRMGAVKKLVKKPEIAKPPVFSKPVNQVISRSSSNEGEPTPIEKVEQEKTPTDTNFEQKSPSDWLKPKIFKNGGLI